MGVRLGSEAGALRRIPSLRAKRGNPALCGAALDCRVASLLVGDD